MSARFLLVAVFLLFVVAPSQVSKTSQGYLLRMKLTKGSTYSYEMTTAATIGTGQPISFSMSYTMKVGPVNKGVADVLMTVKSPMAKEPTTATVKMDSRGALKGQPGMEQMTGARLPEKALKLGDSWKATQTTGQGASAMTVDTVNTFRGVQTVGKVSCAVIDVKATSKGAMAATTAGKLFIEVATGMLYQSNLAGTMTMTQGGKPQTIKNTITIKRK